MIGDIMKGPKKVHYLEPAASIVKRMGGVIAACDALDLHSTTIYSWMKPKSLGGTGGKIPSTRAWACIAAAKALGNVVSPAEFLPPDPQAKKPKSLERGTARSKASSRQMAASI